MKICRYGIVSWLLCFGSLSFSADKNPSTCNKTAAETVEALQNQSGGNTTGKATLSSALGDLQELWGRYEKLGSQPDPKECVNTLSELDCSLFKRFKKSEVFETEAGPRGRSSSVLWAQILRERLQLTAKAIDRLRAPGGKNAEQREKDLTAMQKEFRLHENSDFYKSLKKTYLNDKNDGLDVIRAIRDDLQPPPDPESPNEPVENGICYAIRQSQDALKAEVKNFDEDYLNPKSDVRQKMFGKNMKPFQTQAAQAMKTVVSDAVEPTGRMVKACEIIRNEIFSCLLSKEKDLSHDPQVLKELGGFELPSLKPEPPAALPSAKKEGLKGAG